MIEQQNIVYYGDPRLLEGSALIARPIRAVILTSVRDTGIDDKNGIRVETGNGLQHMEGAIERLVRETYPIWQGPFGMNYAGILTVGRLAGLVDVAGVITDDTEKDMRNSSYSASPEPGRDWIHPSDLRTPEGRLVCDMTYNFPSTFRLLSLVGAEEERRQRKYKFEMQVLQKMRELDGDILISDHLMMRLEYLYREPSLYGRVVNIHPAVTVKNYPYRFLGKTPTHDAIASAKVDPSTRTGATLHFINKTIDDGPPIAYMASTPVYPNDEPQWLRYRNYQEAKLPLFIAGLAHYARNIYPHLGEIDINALQPMVSQLGLNGHGRTQIHENIFLT